ncbi:hypothetical protein MRB53_028060 [Persea americana]|uniref:Uncharacterized protein n=1 Tax=Persea americana TaxID=3435 RepID=A0ACC2KEM7_PERAE|nr:hypothetical protein MRB53_028060 [Persea americana]
MEARVSESEDGIVEFDGSYGIFGVGECETEFEEVEFEEVKDRVSEVKAEGSSSLNGGIRPEEVRISTELGGGEIEGKAENRSNGGSVGFSELGSNRIKKKLEDSVSVHKPRAKEKSHFSGGGNGNFDGVSDGKETRVSFGGRKSDMEVVEGQLGGDLNSPYSVLHDLSTSETSEMVLQAAKGLSYRFETGDMVWGKVKSHPWWPGHIYNEALASSSVRRSRCEGRLLVAFFGDSSYGWFDLAELVPFEPNFAEKSHQTNSRTFVKAVDEAVDELCRRVALGLACRCRNRFNFRPSNVQGYFAVDVFDYEPGGVYSGKQIEKARDSFLPAETLSFVQQVALMPRGGDHSSIDWIKNVALVLAYRKAVFEEFDETYAQAFGIEPVRPPRNEFGELEQPDRVPARAPLSGPLVFAETLGVRKTGNSLKAKDSYKKDKYLFKRRDERVAKQGLNHAGQLQANVVPSPALKEASGSFPYLAGDYVLQKRAAVIPEKHLILMNEEERAIITQECGAPVTKLGSVDSQGWVASPTLLSVDVPMRGGSEEGKLPTDSGHKERDAVLQMSGRMKPDEIVRATSITTDSGKSESHGTMDSVGRAVGQEIEAAFVEDGHEPHQVMVDSGVRSLSVFAGGSHVGKDLGTPSGNAVVGKTTKALKRPIGEDLSSEKHILGEKKKRKKGEDLSSEKHIMGERKKKKKDNGLETSPDQQHKKPKIVKDREALRKLAGKSIGIGSASQEHLQMGSERKDGTSSDSASMFAELDIINLDRELPQLVNDLLALALDPFHAIEHNSTAINSPAIVRHVFLKFRSLVYQKSLVLAKASESVLSNPGAAKSFAGRLLAGSSTATAELTSSVGGRETPASKPLKHPSRVEDPTIMGRKRSPSDRQEEMSAKRLKKLNKLKQLASDKKGSSQKTPDGQKGEQKENGAPSPSPAPVTAKPSKTDPAKKPELPPSETKPTALVMKFPPKTTLPSAPQLKARFARFGPLDLSGIRVFWRSSTCKVVFKYNSDAQTAYNHALQNNSLFGQVRVRYYLRELELPAPELPEASKGQADDSPNNAPPSRPSSSDIVGEPRLSVHQQRQTAVQLKSCLKKPSGDEAGTAVGIAKEIPRVKFLLGGEDSRGEQMQMVTSNINSNNSISGDGASSSSSMTFNVNLKNIKASTIPPQHLLLPPNNSHFRPLWPRPPLPFVHQPSRTPDVLPPTTMPSILPPPPFSNAPSDGHESHVHFRKAPHQMALHAHYKEVEGRKESMVDISHQMLSLLMRCSDIVTNLKSALGYVPYHTL